MRNHDELTLDKLSEEERQEVFDAFGPEKEVQLYGRGIRKRLPTMLGGDERRIRLAYSLAFSLPGTPVLFYGEEIGMAENLAIEGRYSVRSPMQWSGEHQAGFTTAEKAARPVVEDGPFGYRELNVTRQRRDPDSLLNWMERLIRRRRECPELGWGKPTLLDTGDAAVFAQRSDWEGSTVVAVHNLAGRDARTRLELGGEGTLVDLFHDEEHDLDEGAVDPRALALRRPLVPRSPPGAAAAPVGPARAGASGGRSAAGTAAGSSRTRSSAPPSSGRCARRWRGDPRA